VESEKNVLTLVHAKTTLRRHPFVGPGVSFLTAQHHVHSLGGHAHFPRNGRRREALMSKPKRQSTLFVGQVGSPLNLLGE
jgi:hypothetical protein